VLFFVCFKNIILLDKRYFGIESALLGTLETRFKFCILYVYCNKNIVFRSCFIAFVCINKQFFFLAWPNSTLERERRKLNRYLGLERGKVGYGTMCLCKLEEERGLPAGSH
jgi:hypothetical protein